MSESKKKPGVVFWATVALVALLVAYPLSTGPAQWTYCKLHWPAWMGSPIKTIYTPLVSTIQQCPFEVGAAYRAYVNWWTPATPVGPFGER